MIDVAEAIDAESVDMTLTRRPGSYVNGFWVEGAPVVTPIRAAIQPVSGRQLQDMPEGVRSIVSHVIWTRSIVTLNDRITLQNGEVNRVIHVWPRPEGGFHRAAIGKLPS